jgi:hypothetical protein
MVPVRSHAPTELIHRRFKMDHGETLLIAGGLR